ncbi:RRP15-like protein [Sesamum indicum]|uniref:RRP15-like protein n=1 Tax=Sesamum indicum TaxID=4182 RepID=A0A6I9SKX5_SESIN|nr:RRP15-like protein [Sesamum indicum]
MGEVKQSIEVTNGGKKRRVGKNKGKMAKKKQRMMPQGAENRMKVDKRMRKLFQKRAREYNSDEEGEYEQLQQSALSTGVAKFKKSDDEFEGGFSDNSEEENQRIEEYEVSEDEDGGIQPGITKFTEGIKAFKLAFKKVVKKSGGDEEVLGPVLSAHKKLLAEKLAEEEEEKKVKGEAKKEKHLIGEKGHVKPENYLDAHEKFLLSVATKGVVKLFNAVNKAQTAQKGLNPSRSKDEKVIKKRTKEAFFSELGKTSSQSAGTGTVVKVGTSNGSVDGETPAWAPLRDNYMLTNPKLKDWDKMQDADDADDFGGNGQVKILVGRRNLERQYRAME